MKAPWLFLAGVACAAGSPDAGPWPEVFAGFEPMGAPATILAVVGPYSVSEDRAYAALRRFGELRELAVGATDHGDLMFVLQTYGVDFAAVQEGDALTDLATPVDPDVRVTTVTCAGPEAPYWSYEEHAYDTVIEVVSIRDETLTLAFSGQVSDGQYEGEVVVPDYLHRLR